MRIATSLTLLALGTVSVCLAAHDEEGWPVRQEETLQRSFALSGEPYRVVIDNVEGYVHVRGGAGSQVRISAHKVVRAETAADGEEASRDVRLELSEKPGTVTAYYAAPWRCEHRRDCQEQQRHFYRVQFDIDVEVPRAARLFVSTVNRGEIKIENTSGHFEVHDINGGITMTGISGSGEVSTINGPVNVRFAANPKEPSSFKTLNGALDVYFQPNFSADLRFKTFNGQILSDFPVAPRAIGAAAETENKNGRFVYHSKGMSGGRIGSGGPELTFDAFNGTIRLHEISQ